MEKFKMAEKLWELANLITGFAIAQNLTFTFAMAKGELVKSLKGRAAHSVALVFTIIFTSLYIGAIFWCKSKGIIEDDVPSHLSLWTVVTFGRVVAVVLFTLVTLFALLGHANNYPQLEGAGK